MLSLVPCTVLRSVELPATTEGRLPRGSLSLGHMDRSFTFKVFSPCAGCLFNPQVQTSGLKGNSPQNRKATTAVTPQRECSQQQIQGGDPRTGQSPRGRQREHPSEGDHPQNWRATSPRPAGDGHTFNTDDVLALLVNVAYVLAGVSRPAVESDCESGSNFGSIHEQDRWSQLPRGPKCAWHAVWMDELRPDPLWKAFARARSRDLLLDTRTEMAQYSCCPCWKRR